MLVDSHCHLDLLAAHFDVAALIKEAADVGVSTLMTIATSLQNFEIVAQYTKQFEKVYGAIGVHPLNVTQDIIEVQALQNYIQTPKIIAIGETGLDYYKNVNSKKHQQQSLEAHIYAAQTSGKPVVIHTRNADDDTIHIIKSNFKNHEFKGVIHCFTASKKLAYEMLDIGFYISASGIVTFKNATDIRRTLINIPPNRLLVETDAPYLAPAPFRGKLNKPEYVAKIAKFLAEQRNESFEDFARVTTQNFQDLFFGD